MGDVGQQVLYAVGADGDLLLVMAAPAITVFAFRFLKANICTTGVDEAPVLGRHLMVAQLGSGWATAPKAMPRPA